MINKKFIGYYAVIFIVLFHCVSHAAELEHFTEFKLTPRSCIYVGKLTVNGIVADDNNKELRL
ncbi:exported hypothetical protein [Candidatus Magnetomoraceae bacterium gMMP-15]